MGVLIVKATQGLASLMVLGLFIFATYKLITIIYKGITK